jgi:hypothetical protein
MKKIILSILTAVSSLSFAQGWESLGAEGFTTLTGFGSQFKWHNLTSNNNTLYLSLRDGVHGSKATVMIFNGTDWVTLGTPGFSDGAIEFNDLEFDTNNTPYLVFKDGGNAYSPTVMSYDGSDWNLVGTAGIGVTDYCNFQNLEIINDVPFVAYKNTTSAGVEVKSFDGANWNFVGSANFTGSGVGSVGFSHTENIPYVVYSDMSNGDKINVKKYNGTDWVFVGAPNFSASWVAKISIKFSPLGEPYVSFQDNANANKVSVMRFDGTNWVQVGLPGISPNSATYNSLDFYSTGEPVLSYHDGPNQYVTVKVFNGVSWENLGAENASNEIINVPGPGFHIMNDVPYIAYGPTTFNNSVKKFTGCTLDNSIAVTGQTLSVGEPNGTYQWFDCNAMSEIVGETNQNFIALEGGSYSCHFSVNGCVDSTICETISGVGLDVKHVVELSIYPNPVQNELFVALESGQITKMDILDLSGKSVKSIDGNLVNVNISDLNNGIYILKVYTQNGVSNTRFVKQ